jgi:hypothetical protein
VGVAVGAAVLVDLGVPSGAGVRVEVGETYGVKTAMVGETEMVVFDSAVQALIVRRMNPNKLIKPKLILRIMQMIIIQAVKLTV